MNTINLHDSNFTEYDALRSDPGPAAAPVEAVISETKAVCPPSYEDAAVDAAPPAKPDEGALDASPQLAVETEKLTPAVIDATSLPQLKLFDWAGSLLKQISQTLSRLVRSISSISIRTPVLRNDAFDRLARSDEDSRKDVQKADLKKKLVDQEPLKLTVQEHRVQKTIGDDVVIETLRTEESTRSAVTAENKVVSHTTDRKVTMLTR